MDVPIRMSKVTKRFKDTIALDNVTLDSSPGINVILGPNGAGKSTMLRCIMGLYKIEKGRIKILGRDPYISDELKYKISLLSDNYALYDDLSARQNLEFFGRLYGLTKEEIATRAKKILDELDAYKFIDFKVGALSRGTKQKIAFCRSVLNDPDILLMDEPTAFLDATSAAYVRRFMMDYDKKGRTVVFVTQKLDEVLRFNSRLIILSKGKIVKDSKKGAFYKELLRDSNVIIRFVKPVEIIKLKNLCFEKEAGGEKTVNMVNVRINSYRDINHALRTLMSKGIYVLSVEYLEPLIGEAAKMKDGS